MANHVDGPLVAFRGRRHDLLAGRQRGYAVEATRGRLNSLQAIGEFASFLESLLGDQVSQPIRGMSE